MVQDREAADLSFQFRDDDFLLGVFPDRVQVIPQLVAETRFEYIRDAGDVQVIDFPAQFIDAFQVPFPGQPDGDRGGSGFPAGGFRIFPEEDIPADITEPLVIPAGAVQDAFKRHAGLGHDPAGFGIVHIVMRDNPAESRSLQQPNVDRPKGFGHDSAAPEGAAETVSELRCFKRFKDADRRNIPDDFSGFLQDDCPVGKRPGRRRKTE